MYGEKLYHFIKDSPLEDITNALTSGKIGRGESYYAFNIAIKYNKLDVLKYLIDEQYDDFSFCLTDKNKNELLGYLSYGADLEIFKYLLEKNIIQSENLEKDNVLGQILVSSKNDLALSIVKFLIEDKAYNVHTNDEHALLQVVCNYNPLTSQYLIDKGANVSINNFSPYLFAASSGCIEMLKILEKNNGEPVPNSNSAFFEAIDFNEPTDEIVLYLINKGWNLDDEQCQKYQDDSLISEDKLNFVRRLIDTIRLEKDLPIQERIIRPKNKI